MVNNDLIQALFLGDTVPFDSHSDSGAEEG
jgi:hypothetical protein